MNRRRALVLYEMRTMRWVLMAGMLCVLVFLMILNGYLRNNSILSVFLSENIFRGDYGSCFSCTFLGMLYDNHVIILLLLAIMVSVQFRDLHRRQREEFMSSLPFAKRERFLIKSLTGLAVLFTNWLVLAVGTLIVRQNVIVQYHRRNLLLPYYKELLANETVWHTVRTLGIFGLEMLAVYMIFVVLHSMVNKSAVASIFGLGVILAPVLFAYTVNRWYIWITGTPMPDDMGGWEHLARVFIGDSLAVFPLGEYSDITPCYYISYWPAWQVVLVLLAVILICTAVIWRMSCGRDAADNNVLVVHRGARIFLAVGMGLCLGAVLAWLFSESFLRINDVFYSFVVSEIILSPILIYASWKILKISIR